MMPPVIIPDDAPPYTLETLHFANPLAAQSAFLLVAQIIHATETLRALLAPGMGITVAPHETFAFSELRRDLAVTSDRMRELNRTISKPFNKKKAND